MLLARPAVRVNNILSLRYSAVRLSMRPVRQLPSHANALLSPRLRLKCALHRLDCLVKKNLIDQRL
jgi:hypothetical protein